MEITLRGVMTFPGTRLNAGGKGLVIHSLAGCLTTLGYRKEESGPSKSLVEADGHLELDVM